MSTREELEQMILLTLTKIGEAQDACAAALGGMEATTAATVRIPATVEAAHALTLATIGTGDSRPEPATKLAEQMHVASLTVPDLLAAMELTSGRLQALFEQLAAAGEAAREYRALPK